jgi:sulfatase maturation enzyme AslB (radical SAM superfamily)
VRPGSYGPVMARVTPAATSADSAAGVSEAVGPPLGSRLWIYTNFECNLACDYCCAQSMPRPAQGARHLPVEVAARAGEEFAGLGGRELLLTGGEPFLHADLGALVEAAGRYLAGPVVILTNAMVFGRGRRYAALQCLDRSRVVLQVSLDSGTPALHDAHRGAGSFARARAGIELARSLGFRVKVAATVDAADTAEVASLHALLDADGIPRADRLVRPVARQGFADRGLVLTIDTLHPEPALAVDGAWWHPVAITDPSMQVASLPLPVVTIFAVVAATMNARRADPNATLQAFRCT